MSTPRARPPTAGTARTCPGEADTTADTTAPNDAPLSSVSLPSSLSMPSRGSAAGCSAGCSALPLPSLVLAKAGSAGRSAGCSALAGRGRRWLLTSMLVTAALACPSPAPASPRSIGAAGASTTTVVPAPRGWRWPLSPRPPVVRSFDPPEQRWSAGHRGVDLKAAAGVRVLAPAAGTVAFVGVVVDRPVLTIAHADGLRSSFEPVTTALHRGDAVTAGQLIGRIATPTHCDPASCLHWGVRLGEDYVDPLSLITDRRPSVLLPVAVDR